MPYLWGSFTTKFNLTDWQKYFLCWKESLDLQTSCVPIAVYKKTYHRLHYLIQKAFSILYIIWYRQRCPHFYKTSVAIRYFSVLNDKFFLYLKYTKSCQQRGKFEVKIEIDFLWTPTLNIRDIYQLTTGWDDFKNSSQNPAFAINFLQACCGCH